MGRTSSPIQVFTADQVIVYGEVQSGSVFSRDVGRKNSPARRRQRSVCRSAYASTTPKRLPFVPDGSERASTCACPVSHAIGVHSAPICATPVLRKAVSPEESAPTSKRPKPPCVHDGGAFTYCSRAERKPTNLRVCAFAESATQVRRQKAGGRSVRNGFLPSAFCFLPFTAACADLATDQPLVARSLS